MRHGIGSFPVRMWNPQQSLPTANYTDLPPRSGHLVSPAAAPYRAALLPYRLFPKHRYLSPGRMPFRNEKGIIKWPLPTANHTNLPPRSGHLVQPAAAPYRAALLPHHLFPKHRYLSTGGMPFKIDEGVTKWSLPTANHTNLPPRSGHLVQPAAAPYRAARLPYRLFQK